MTLISADLDPSIYFVCDRLENDEVQCWEPNPGTPKCGFGSRFQKNRRGSLPTSVDVSGSQRLTDHFYYSQFLVL